MTEHTTPFEREILTYFHTGGGHAGQFPRPTPLYWYTVERFVDMGILTRNDIGDIVPNEEPMRMYMDALAAVPLPVQVWKVPA